MSELMKDIPNDKPDKETIRKQVQEFMELKNQVTIKRRQLKALGVKDDPELSSMMIKYPDLQAQYKQKVAKAASKPAAVKADPPTTKQVVPVDSPFIDPNAKPVKIIAPAPEPVKVQQDKPAPVPAAPAPTPALVPISSKPIDIPVAPAPVQRRVQTNVVSTPLRVAHDGRWLF
jgi:hypothetical protein